MNVGWMLWRKSYIPGIFAKFTAPMSSQDLEVAVLLYILAIRALRCLDPKNVRAVTTIDAILKNLVRM